MPNRMEIADTRLGWRLVNPLMRDLHGVLAMGETAEEVADRTGISRDGRTPSRCAATGTPRPPATPDSSTRNCCRWLPRTAQRWPRTRASAPDTSPEKLAGLKPVFKVGGTVTAGNSSPLNDGAAGLFLASAEGLTRLGLEPIARYVAGASAGVHPDVMGLGPIPATAKVLARAGWTAADLDTAEVNEAFAVQALASLDGIGLDEAAVNPTGGAIALGHPLGCSGARIVTTLAHRMRRDGLRRGLATMCVGVGQGSAVLLESV